MQVIPFFGEFHPRQASWMTPEDVVSTVNQMQVWMGEENPPVVCRTSEVMATVLRIPPIGAEEGDNVVASPLVPLPMLQPVREMGVEIRWADLHPASGTMQTQHLPVDARTRAIITHDPPGAVNDYQALSSYGIPVVEDASFAIGTVYQYLPLSRSGGDVVIFDLPSSLVAAEGRACFVFTHLGFPLQEQLASALNLAEWEVVLHRLGEDVEAGRQTAKAISRALQGYRTGFRWIHVEPYDPTVTYSVFPLLCSHAESLVSYLRSCGISACLYEQIGQHHWNTTGFPTLLPGAEFFVRHAVVLPCGWWVGPQEREQIASAIRRWVEWR